MVRKIKVILAVGVDRGVAEKVPVLGLLKWWWQG